MDELELKSKLDSERQARRAEARRHCEEMARYAPTSIHCIDWPSACCVAYFASSLEQENQKLKEHCVSYQKLLDQYKHLVTSRLGDSSLLASLPTTISADLIEDHTSDTTCGDDDIGTGEFEYVTLSLTHLSLCCVVARC
jgi:hypothetical protein